MRTKRTLTLATLVPALTALLAIAILTTTIQPAANPAHAQGSLPVVPTGLTVLSSTHNSVALTWTDPSDSSITGYQILRRSVDRDQYGDGLGAPEFVVIHGDTGSAATTYTDSSVTARTRYVYRIKARNSAGLSSWSTFANAETGEAPDIPPTPAITSMGPFAIEEGQTAIAQLTATDSDTVPADLNWTKTGGADADAFALTDSGVLTFTVAKDYEDPDDGDGDGTYEVTVQVSDGTDTDSAELVVALTNVIELKTITGPSEVAFIENSGGRVATFMASTEADRNGITWTISGTDGAHFAIDSPPGALRFLIDPVSPNLFPEPPDFDDPNDDTGDNEYELKLEAAVGSNVSSSFSVTVTVTDQDESGTIALSATRPKAGTALTATLTDPDGVTDGTTSWQWERNNGREGWTVIAGARSASYTPTGADGDRYLRARATYTDSFGADKTAEAMAPHVVIAHRLSALTVPGLSGVTNDDRAFYPAFDPDTLHYAARCTESITLTLTTENAGTRLSVNGVQRPNGAAFTVDGLSRESDIRITLTGAMGASTTYTVHCIDREQFPKLTTVKAEGAAEDLMMFRAKWRPPAEWWRGALIMMDNNGVPRLRKHIDDNVLEYFRVYPDETHPRARYAFTKQGTSFDRDGVELVELDKYFNTVEDDVHILSPFNNTDGHDQMILPNGDYVLMAYSRHQRDLRFVQTAFPDLTDSEGGPLGTNEGVRDGVIQVRKADGTVKFNWSSWDHMAIEDCIRGNKFDVGGQYAHINSLGLIDGDIIAGFRKCSKILRIDLDTGDVVWRAGPSILSREQWEAGETLQSNRGPAPLEFVNDPRGGFSGQHGGRMTVEENLLVYDNATFCELPPGIPSDAKGLTQCHTRTRAVEYAIDLPNKELVFQREFRMLGPSQGGPAGHADPLNNGDWVISWSYTTRPGPRSGPMPNTAMHVDAQTGAEKLSMTLENIIGSVGVGAPVHTRVSMVSPVALAPRIEPLKATFPPSGHTSIFHSGTGDSQQAIVAFNRPVVDFASASPSLSVTGGTVASVSAHVVAGESANAYLVTLTPDGDGAITFQLVANQGCADGGICAADGATLADVPAALVIVPPITVSFDQVSYSEREGNTLIVGVQLSSAHQGVRGINIPISADPTGATSTDDYSARDDVTFRAGDRLKIVAIEVFDDDLVEGPEAVIISFGTLPTGVTGGSVASSEITLTDMDRAAVRFELSSSQVAEGGETRVTFTIDNGVAFQGNQQINLALSGSAMPGDDFILKDAADSTLSQPYAITFPAMAASAYFTFFAVDDTEGETAAETVTLSATLTQPGHAETSLGPRTITIPANDLPSKPVVTISAGISVTEGADISFELSRTDALDLPIANRLTVPIQVTSTGSTLRGATPSSVAFVEDSSTASVQVATLDDAVVEPPGEVRVLVLADLNSSPRYLVGPMNAATGTVNDNDVAAFSVASSSAEVSEGRSVSVTVETVGVTFADNQSFNLNLAGTATVGKDFTLGGPNGVELLAPYEFTLPAGARSVSVTIGATRDAEDDAGETVEVSVSHKSSAIGTVAITIANEGDPGEVTLSQVQPRVGALLTATLTDPDGSVSGENWEWERSLDQTNWVFIRGAGSNGYTPVDGDVGSFLRVTVFYTDQHGSGNRTEAVSINAVKVEATNQDPMFTEGASTTRSVAENTAAGSNIGDPIAARDTNGDRLTYSLGGTDSAVFRIVASSGQLQTNAARNYDAKNAYAVTVSVRDGKDPDRNPDSRTDDTIRVAITVTNGTETQRTPIVTRGGGSGGSGGGGGGFVPPQPRLPTSDFQPVGQLFRQLSAGGTLGRVWRLIEPSQRWLFYDPQSQFTPFNTLRTVNLASDPPAVVIVHVSRAQQFRGLPLYAGWNFVPIASEPLAARPGSNTQPVEQVLRPLADSRVLQRVWWLDSRTQEWKFYDPEPRFAAFNTLTTIDLAANPPVVLAVSVDRRTKFRGRTLYKGWNYVVMR